MTLDSRVCLLLLCLVACGACGTKTAADPAAEAPPAPKVEEVQDSSVFKVDQPGDFPLATATEIDAASTLTATVVVRIDSASGNITFWPTISGREAK